MLQRGSALVILLVIIGVLSLGGFGLYLFLVSNPEKIVSQPSVCLDETKLCSDGSSVGRSGPNCEFAACPTLRLNIFARVSPTLIPIPPKNLICSTEKDLILKAITGFETAQQTKDVLEVFKYFTKPTLDSEIKSYTRLIGVDQGDSPRLYSERVTNFRLISFKVTRDPLLSEKSCKIIVEESRSNYSSSTVEEYLPPEPVSQTLLMIKDQTDSTWKIDRYYPVGGVSSKYGGWGY